MRPIVKIEDYIPTEIARRERTLSHLGVDEGAYTYQDAIKLVEHLAEGPVAILGGDVYEDSSQGLRPTYEGWYCDPSPGEALDAYRKRSRDKALEYLKAFPDTTAWFVLVMSDEATAVA